MFYTELPGDPDAPNTGDGKGDKRRILRGYTVLNASQIDGLPPEYFAEATPPAPRDDDGARLTALFAKLPITVRHGGDRAYYAMAPDVIQMPLKSAFAVATQYFATRAHETLHYAARRIMPRANQKSVRSAMCRRPVSA